MLDKLRQNRGQTLLELVVAMSIISIGLLGVFAVLSESLGLNKIVANQYTAVGLAAEGIEVVKNIADSNVVAGRPWNTDLTSDNKFGAQYNSEVLDRDLADRKLNFNSSRGVYSYDSGKPTNFKRIITLRNISENEIQVNSKVEWTDRGGRKFSIDLEDRLFNWR